MSRAIDVDTLKTAIDNGWKPDMMVSEIWDIIDEVPTTEAESVRTGHWKRRRLRVTASCLYKCSACGQCVNTADIWAYKFCYHCGAKMDEVSE